MNDRIPPIWVISLERAADRRRFVQDRFGSLGIEFELLDAVDADEMSPAQSSKYSRRRALFELGRPLYRGEIGCALSHLEALRRLVMSGEPVAVIMEDDVEPTPDLVPVLSELEKLPPNWDVATLYSLFDRSEPYRIDDRLIAGKFHVCRYRKTAFGTQCYAIRAEAAQRVLDQAMPLRMPFDDLLYRRHPVGLEVYGFEPQVVREGGFDSEIVARPPAASGSPLSAMFDRSIALGGKVARRVVRRR